MTDIHVLAIDLAKRSFQVCAAGPGGACGCPPFSKRFFEQFYWLGASIGRVSGLWCGRTLTTGRYAVRRTRSTSVQRALPLEPRDWFSPP